MDEVGVGHGHRAQCWGQPASHRARRQCKRIPHALAVAPHRALHHRPSSSASTRSMRAARSRLWVAMRAASPLLAHDAEQDRDHLVGGVMVEIAGGLVAQQHARAVGERADDGDALLLAARKPRRAMLGAGLEPHLLQQRERPRARRSLGRAGDHLRQHHVLERREFRQEMMELIDEAQGRAPHLRALEIGHAGRIRARPAAPRRHPAARAGPRHEEASICRRPTARPAPRSRPA